MDVLDLTIQYGEYCADCARFNVVPDEFDIWAAFCD